MTNNCKEKAVDTCASSESELICDEYKYRHEHCWATMFRLTNSAVLLGIVPYLDKSVLDDLGPWIVAPPLVAVALIVFAMLRMKKELQLLSQVKELHRDRQKNLFNFYKKISKSTFSNLNP